MANETWSAKIQGILTLDWSREVRFRDDRKSLFLDLLGLVEGMTILDVGCGPGTLTRKLSKWLDQDTKIIGLDRDTAFVEYARGQAVKMNLSNIDYIVGDALQLPLDDNSVDACISHTVIEHVPHREFLLEQKRVCRPEGRVSVMWARPDKYIKTEPAALPPRSEREAELMEKLFKESSEVLEEHNVGKYWPDPVALPTLFQHLGFCDVQVDAIAVPIAIDDARNSLQEKMALVEAQRNQAYESVDMAARLGEPRLSRTELTELRTLVNARSKGSTPASTLWTHSFRQKENSANSFLSVGLLSVKQLTSW